MKSDLTRLTFDQAKHYRAVQQQQGRVQLDSDWNEQLDITEHRVEIETVDVVGRAGAPLHDDGFWLVASASGLTAKEAAREGNQNPPAVPAGDLLITAGRLYVDGVLAENDRITLASAQPDLPTLAQFAKLGATVTLPAKVPGTYLVYLDLWPRLRTAIDDAQIREVALGGPDTATRIKNAWQVKCLTAAAGDDCASSNAAWDALVNPKLGTLAASVAKTTSKPGPCIVDPGAGYRRLENQLYRVEVHIGGDSLAKAAFKWSRDNGAIVTRWIGKKPLSSELEVESVGRDKVLNIAPGHWVELTDDAHEELGLPGTFALVTKVLGNTITIDSAQATGPVEFDFFPKNPKVRRWDSKPAKPGKWIAPDGEKTLNSAATFELEDGVVVRFGAGAFRTGDYWLIPARTALPFVEWPTLGDVAVPQPPRGVAHHYCKLATIEVGAGGKITDCRNLFPPLTELTSLFYVSGESQEVRPDPTQPPATLLPLAAPLKVGVSNGQWPVEGSRVRFTIKVGAGALTPASGIVTTGADGVASCNWSLDSATPNQEVLAELLDAAAVPIHLPIVFHARLNTASLVSYDPAKCEGMKNATPPVVTVQEALDFLCHERAAVDCCVTVGRLGDRPGDYETVAAAVEDLLLKRQFPSVCLSLLPGDHLIGKGLLVAPADGKRPTHFKIAGCSHASRLIVKTSLEFKGLQGAVIRDISILVEGGSVLFNDCGQVEVSDCQVNGRSAESALLQAGGVPHFTLANNRIQALGSLKPSAPSKFFGGVDAWSKNWSKIFALVDDRDFASQATKVADALAELPLRERTRMARELAAAEKEAGAELTPAERKAYAEMASALVDERAGSRTFVTRLSAIRAAAAVSPAGLALTLLDFEAEALLSGNQIAGVVSFGDSPATRPLPDAALKPLAALINKGQIQITPSAGRLHLSGNAILQVAPDRTSIAALRQALDDGKGTVPVWASAHLTDNIIGRGENYLVAHHVSLNATRFPRLSEDAGVVVAGTATYVGNSANNDGRLFSLTRLSPPAQAANQVLSIIVL